MSLEHGPPPPPPPPSLKLDQHLSLTGDSVAPSVDECIKKLWYFYTMENYSAIKKREILPFVTAWMNPDSIMLSEISL